MNVARLAFFLSTLIIVTIGSFAFGAFSFKRNQTPIPELREAYYAIMEVLVPSDKFLEALPVSQADSDPVKIYHPDQLQPGLVLVSGDEKKRFTTVRVIDRSGRVIKEWKPNWQEIWPDDQGDFPLRPRKSMYLHGLEILPDGSIVANFEHLSTVRIDICGKVMWKLDNLGHHSVHHAADGTLWVSAETPVDTTSNLPSSHGRKVRQWTIQNYDLSGQMLDEISMFDVFLKNDLHGMLYMSSITNGGPSVDGDTLHLNDVETFPDDLDSEIFAPGDLLVSLRNTNTIMVFDRNSYDIKFIKSGSFVRQHDPDFIQGDKISVFDNRNFSLPNGAQASRVVEVEAISGNVTSILDENSQRPFFTDIMGNHQRLENGNILVVASQEGRVMEYLAKGDLAWRYDHRVKPMRNMRIYNSMVLPLEMNEAFFESRIAACGVTN